METHPDNCFCADCVPNCPDTREEEEQQHQEEITEQLAALTPCSKSS